MSYTVAKGNQMVDPDDVSPADGVVDLRSDTVTRPSEEMRRAMPRRRWATMFTARIPRSTACKSAPGGQMLMADQLFAHGCMGQT